MNKMQKNIFALVAMLVWASHANADSGGCGATPYFSFRSTGENLAREQVGWEEEIHLFDQDSIYGAFYIAPYYQQTFNSDRLAQCIFGSDINCNNSCGGVINISGSCVTGRGANDWLADYFGLPTDFQSSVTFRPRIRNFVLDLGFFLGFDEVARGLWLRVHMPINWTSWNLGWQENITADGANGYPIGYFSDTANSRENLLNSAAEFFAEGKVPNLLKCDGTSIKFNQLCCTRWAQDCGGCSGTGSKGLTKTRPADVEVILGWDAFADEDYHFGFGVRFTAPTGNKPDGDYLFEPVVGLGGNWTLGGTITAHAILWRSEDEDSSFGFYFDTNISHLFKTCQSRCFDLKCKPNSRYALAMRLGDNASALGGCVAGAFTASDSQFADEYASVANLTRSNVNVSASVQGDVALKFTYTRGGFAWDLGYNFYGRSCEDICVQSGCNNTVLSEWALKGDAQVYGFNNNFTTPLECPGVALAPSNSEATIHGGTNRTDGDCTTAANLLNPRIDNPQLAAVTSCPVTVLGTGPLSVTNVDNTQTRTSIQPVTLSSDLVDFKGTRIISNKIYTNINYAWLDKDDWTPFLGLGAEVEFRGGCCDNNCSNDCNSCCVTTSTTNTTNGCCSNSCGSSGSCSTCGTNSWGIWLKGGVSFN